MLHPSLRGSAECISESTTANGRIESSTHVIFRRAVTFLRITKRSDPSGSDVPVLTESTSITPSQGLDGDNSSLINITDLRYCLLSRPSILLAVPVQRGITSFLLHTAASFFGIRIRPFYGSTSLFKCLRYQFKQQSAPHVLFNDPQKIQIDRDTFIFFESGFVFPLSKCIGDLRRKIVSKLSFLP